MHTAPRWTLATLFALLVAGIAVAGVLVPAARAAGDEKDAEVPCDQADQAIAKAPAGGRLYLAESFLKRRCTPMPATIRGVLEEGAWPGGAKAESEDRLLLLTAAVAAHDAEAESLNVQILESGAWPEGTGLTLQNGIKAVKALAPALNRYRTRLLLDVYEQRTIPPIRVAVLETLRSSKSPEALLPALDAYWTASGEVQEAAMKTISSQPDKSASETLAGLIRDLPKGPLLEWAVQLGKAYPAAPVSEAMKARGITG